MNKIKNYGYLILSAGLAMGLLSSCATKQETKTCTMGEGSSVPSQMSAPVMEAQNEGQMASEEKSSTTHKHKKSTKKHKKTTKKTATKKKAVKKTATKVESGNPQVPATTEAAPASQNTTPTMEAGKEMAPKAPVEKPAGTN